MATVTSDLLTSTWFGDLYVKLQSSFGDHESYAWTDKQSYVDLGTLTFDLLLP